MGAEKQSPISKELVGGNSEGDHLFPFRTEKLSPSAPMVLALKAGRVGHCQLFYFLVSKARMSLDVRAFVVAGQGREAYFHPLNKEWQWTKNYHSQ